MSTQLTAYEDHSGLSIWNDEEVWIVGAWSLANDTGDAGVYHLMSVPANHVILDGYLWVSTACTADTDATFEVGKVGDTACIIAQTAKAVMAKNYIKPLAAKQMRLRR
jgi:hypothetical protein